MNIAKDRKLVMTLGLAEPVHAVKNKLLQKKSSTLMCAMGNHLEAWMPISNTEIRYFWRVTGKTKHDTVRHQIIRKKPSWWDTARFGQQIAMASAGACHLLGGYNYPKQAFEVWPQEQRSGSCYKTTRLDYNKLTSRKSYNFLLKQ